MKTGKTYKNKTEALKDLRYGQICFLTDQDLDGTHIKGLCINLFNSQWNDLFKMNGLYWIYEYTYIKATKGLQRNHFIMKMIIKNGRKNNNGGKGWKVKYYKGLGTSYSKEFKEYFKNKKIITFSHCGETSRNAIDKAFNKNRADDRKEWLGDYDKNRRLATNKKRINIENFIDDDLIHFQNMIVSVLYQIL